MNTNFIIIILIILLIVLYNKKDSTDIMRNIFFICCVVAGIFTGFATFHWLYSSSKELFIKQTINVENIHPASITKN